MSGGTDHDWRQQETCVCATWVVVVLVAGKLGDTAGRAYALLYGWLYACRPLQAHPVPLRPLAPTKPSVTRASRELK